MCSLLIHVTHTCTYVQIPVSKPASHPGGGDDQHEVKQLDSKDSEGDW